MSFVLVIYAFFLIFLTMMKYRKIFSVILISLFLFSITTAVMVYGLNVFKTLDLWFVFGKHLDRMTFTHLIIVLYAFDCICTALIFKNYLAYRKFKKQ